LEDRVLGRVKFYTLRKHRSENNFRFMQKRIMFDLLFLLYVFEKAPIGNELCMYHEIVILFSNVFVIVNF